MMKYNTVIMKYFSCDDLEMSGLFIVSHLTLCPQLIWCNSNIRLNSQELITAVILSSYCCRPVQAVLFLTLKLTYSLCVSVLYFGDQCKALFVNAQVGGQVQTAVQSEMCFWFKCAPRRYTENRHLYLWHNINLLSGFYQQDQTKILLQTCCNT